MGCACTKKTGRYNSIDSWVCTPEYHATDYKHAVGIARGTVLAQGPLGTTNHGGLFLRPPSFSAAFVFCLCDYYCPCRWHVRTYLYSTTFSPRASYEFVGKCEEGHLGNGKKRRAVPSTIHLKLQNSTLVAHSAHCVLYRIPNKQQ